MGDEMKQCAKKKGSAAARAEARAGAAVPWRLQPEVFGGESSAFEELAEIVNKIVWTSTVDGQMTFFNSLWTKITGMSRAEGLGAGWQAAVHPEDLERVNAEIQLGIKTQTGYVHELRYGNPATGNYRWFLERVVVHKCSASGELQRVGSCTDIDAARRARRQSEIFFRAPERISCMTSAEGRFLRVNPAFAKTFGYSVEDVLQLSVLDLLHIEDIAAAQHNIKALKQGERVSNLVNRIRCANGAYRFVSWSAEAVDGITYCIGIDITELKEAEARLEQVCAARHSARVKHAVGE